MRVLELGNTIAPAYAGMLLAEQGHEVTKWQIGPDPLLRLEGGADLQRWLNAGKRIEARHAMELLSLLNTDDWPNVILDNFRPSTLAAWGIDPDELARRHDVVWVSLRSEEGEVSFDLIAQARSWMEYAPWIPFYVGDTSAGLWMAFKAASAYARYQYGHYVLGQASCLQKMVEGELILDPPRDRRHPRIPWNPLKYRFSARTRQAIIEWKGRIYREPVRDRAWKLAHLWHDGTGRIRI